MVETNTAPAVDRDLQKTFAGIMAPQVEQGVANGIEEKLEDVRHGRVNFFTGSKDENPGFFQQLLGMLFQFLEAIGMDKMVAGWLGMHIPDGDEKKALSGQITRSLSEAFATKDVDGKLVATQMSEEELQAALKDKLTADIKNNPALKSFSDENVAEAVEKAVAKATSAESISKLNEASKSLTESVVTIPAVAATAPTTDRSRTQTTSQQRVEETLGQMADSIMNNLPPSTEPKDREKAQALKPEIIKIGAAVVMSRPDLLNNPDGLKDALINGMEKNGIAIPPEAKAFLEFHIPEHLKKGFGDRLAQDMREESPGVTAASNTPSVAGTLPKLEIWVDPLETAAAVAKNPQIKNNPKQFLADKVAEGIKSEAVDAVVKNYNESWLTRNIYGGPPGDAIAVLNNAATQSAGDINEARDKVYNWAVNADYAPNDAQRARIGELTAEATLKTLENPKHESLSRQQLANRVQLNIESALERNTPSINELGRDPIIGKRTSIKEISENAERDVLFEVRKEIGDRLYNAEKDKDPEGNLFGFADAYQKSSLHKQKEREASIAVAAREAGAGARNAGMTGDGAEIAAAAVQAGGPRSAPQIEGGRSS